VSFSYVYAEAADTSITPIPANAEAVIASVSKTDKILFFITTPPDIFTTVEEDL
jgi:hypothetical protein